MSLEESLSSRMEAGSKTGEGAWPCDAVVQFSALCFGSPGLRVRILSTDLYHSSAMLWQQPTCKVEEDWQDVSSGLMFLNKSKRKKLMIIAKVTSEP